MPRRQSIHLVLKDPTASPAPLGGERTCRRVRASRSHLVTASDPQAPRGRRPAAGTAGTARRRPGRTGGGDRIRTDDRLVANQVLYQLSYAPCGSAVGRTPGPGGGRSHGPWWACVDLNHGPPAYQADALTN